MAVPDFQSLMLPRELELSGQHLARLRQRVLTSIAGYPQERGGTRRAIAKRVDSDYFDETGIV